MTKVPEIAKGKIPERLKSDNWAFHALARSDDPAIKCQNVVNLVKNLKTTLEMAGIIDEDIDGLKIYKRKVWVPVRTLREFIDYQILGAHTSWKCYSSGQPGQAVEIAGAVLEEVLFLVYDPKITTPQADVKFTGQVQ